MPADDAAKAKKRWQRYGLAMLAVLGAFGIFSAIGGNLIDEIFPSVSEGLTGAGLIRATVRPVDNGSDGFHLATWSRQGVQERLGEVDDCVSLFEAGRESGGVDIGLSYRNVVLEGTTHRDVTIVDLRAEIVRRSDPMDGAEITCASAGALGSIGLSFDFDEPHPAALRVSEGPDDETPFFGGGNVIVLEEGEVQPLQVLAEVSHDYVAWNLIADLIVDGEAESVTIDDNGKPFQITGGEEALDYDRYYEWLWAETPPRMHVGPEPGF